MSLEELRKTLEALHEPGEVIEIRCPKADRWKKTHAGYFDNFDLLARAARQLSEHQGVPNVYTTLDPVSPNLLARAYNRVIDGLEEGFGTKDKNIVVLRTLFFDADPHREQGISSTDDGHDRAIQRIVTIAEYLGDQGWPPGVRGDSGNGGHGIWHIDLENTAENVELRKRCLQSLDVLFSDKLDDNVFDDRLIKIDKTTFNPSRICKFHGTWARKGDHLPGVRPHRRSCLLYVPDQKLVVPREFLVALAEAGEATKAATVELPGKAPGAHAGASRVNMEKIRLEQDRINRKTCGDSPGGAWTPERLEAWLNDHRVIYKAKGKIDHRLKYPLDHCVFDDSHTGKDAAIFLDVEGLSIGKLGYKCFHDSCSKKSWADVRELFEPKESRTFARTAESTSDLPRICVTNRQLRDIVKDSFQAIHEANLSPNQKLFMRGNTPVQLVKLEGRTALGELGKDALLTVLSQSADWIKINIKGKELDANPPDDVQRSMLGTPDWGLPVITGIVETPVFLEGGRLLNEEGYDQGSRIYYQPSGDMVGISVGANPGEPEVKAAVSLLMDDRMLILNTTM